MFGVGQGVTRAFEPLLELEIVREGIGRWTLDRPELLDEPVVGVNKVHQCGHEDKNSFRELNALEPTPQRLAERPETADAPPWTVFECENVQLVCSEGLTFLANGRILLENSLGWNKRVGVSAARSLFNRTLPVRLNSGIAHRLESAVSLVGPWTDNYYHWNIDYLSRLAALSAYTATTGHQPPLLRPPETSGWMCEALSLAGYEEEDWIVWDGQRTNIDQLVVPTLPRDTEASAPNLTDHNYSLNPHSVRWLGRRTRSNAGKATNQTPDSNRLFVSRQGIASRHIVNFDELSDLLDAYGFEPFRPEKYSVADQVATFADVDVILGVHGAGLTNLMFATDATLLELFGDYVNPVFYILSVLTGSDYACASFEPNGNGIIIDPVRLRDLFNLAEVDSVV